MHWLYNAYIEKKIVREQYFEQKRTSLDLKMEPIRKQLS